MGATSMARRWCVVVVGMATVVAGLTAGSVATAETASYDGPSLQLLRSQDQISVTRRPGQVVRVWQFPIFVAPKGGALDLRVSRPDYAHPLAVTQVIHGSAGDQERALPDGILHGWDGLDGFIQLTVRNRAGDVVKQVWRRFCPNSYEQQRIDPDGSSEPSFPYGCYANLFSLGNVWGIDDGWAVSAFGYRGIKFTGPDGRYTVTAALAPRYQRLFQVPAADASTKVTVVVTTRKRTTKPSPASAKPAYGPDAVAQPEKLPAVPTVAAPNTTNLPDLNPLPAFGLSVRHSHGRDLLSFGANFWVGGTSRLDVQGFRRPGTDLMDAYQYFYNGDEVVGRADVGTLEYDRRKGHHHWHLEMFAGYSLLDGTKTEVVRSHKQSFCIAPTDMIDLTLPDADWRPDGIGLSSACGGEDALWVRETLPVGWGDTYYQYVAGQSFNITSLPNGTYYVQVKANPTGELFEADTSNDVSLRRVILKGTPGHRRVCVPAVHGIDDEGCR